MRTPSRRYGATEPTEQCRTCKGTGKITRKDKEGIAVIAYGDERLAPSKTAVYITIAVILFLALTGTLVTLFYPRTVSASSSTVSIIYANITQNDTTLVLQDTVNVKNSNYFGATLALINISVTFQLKEVGTNSTKYTHNTTSPIRIGARKTVPLNYTINATFTRDTGSDDIWAYCCNRTTRQYNLGFQVQVNTVFNYFSSTFEFSDLTFQTSSCPHVSKDTNKTCYMPLQDSGYKQDTTQLL